MRIIHDPATALTFGDVEPGCLFRRARTLYRKLAEDSAYRVATGAQVAFACDEAIDAAYPKALLILEPTPAELRRLADEMEVLGE